MTQATVPTYWTAALKQQLIFCASVSSSPIGITSSRWPRTPGNRGYRGSYILSFATGDCSVHLNTQQVPKQPHDQVNTCRCTRARWHTSTYSAIPLRLLKGGKQTNRIRFPWDGDGLFFDWTPLQASPDSSAAKYAVLGKSTDEFRPENAFLSNRIIEPLRKMRVGAWKSLYSTSHCSQVTHTPKDWCGSCSPAVPQ